MATTDHLSAEELFKHVQDATYFHVPRFMTEWGGDDAGHGDGGHGDGEHGEASHHAAHPGHIELPQPLAKPKVDSHGHPVIDPHTHSPVYESVWESKTGNALIDKSVLPLDFVFTKFMAIELMVAIICVALFGWLAARLRGGKAPRGIVTNLLETFLVFLRDEVAYPAIGKKDAPRFLPFLWTLFFFVLGCNLFGMLPWMGSPTGVLAVTASMAMVTFIVVVASGVKELGFVGFLKAQAPHMDLPLPLKLVLLPMIWVLEVFGLLLKHGVLAVRLLANMIAGHLILAVLVGFIGFTAGSAIVFGVIPVSILASVAMSVLELFVAFLQAYIFTFLSALFIGAAVHPH